MPGSGSHVDLGSLVGVVHGLHHHGHAVMDGSEVIEIDGKIGQPAGRAADR